MILQGPQGPKGQKGITKGLWKVCYIKIMKSINIAFNATMGYSCDC